MLLAEFFFYYVGLVATCIFIILFVTNENRRSLLSSSELYFLNVKHPSESVMSQLQIQTIMPPKHATMHNNATMKSFISLSCDCNDEGCYKANGNLPQSQWLNLNTEHHIEHSCY